MGIQYREALNAFRIESEYRTKSEGLFSKNNIITKYKRRRGRLIAMVCFSPSLFPIPPESITKRIIKKDLIP